jgi:hypothetical protein
MPPAIRDQYFINLMKASVEVMKYSKADQLHKSVITDVCGALNTPLDPDAGGSFETRWKIDTTSTITTITTATTKSVYYYVYDYYCYYYYYPGV